jgi:hypothetical protein
MNGSSRYIYSMFLQKKTTYIHTKMHKIKDINWAIHIQCKAGTSQTNSENNGYQLYTYHVYVAIYDTVRHYYYFYLLKFNENIIEVLIPKTELVKKSNFSVQ